MPRVLLSPPFTATDRAVSLTNLPEASVRLRAGASMTAFLQDADALRHRYGITGDNYAALTLADQTAATERAIRPQALALTVFAVLAGLIGLAVTGQLLARQLALDAGDFPVLRAIGVARGRLTAEALARLLAVTVPAAAAAGVIAVAASPLMPIGPARQAEPAPGFSLDLPVLAGGCVAVALLPVAALVPSAWRAARGVTRLGGASGPAGAGATAFLSAARPSRLATALGHAGWVTGAVGMRMAFEPGRGRTAVPVRTALAGTAVAIGAVAAASVFAWSLLALVGTPARYGQNWDAKLDAGYADIPASYGAQLLAGVPGIAGYALGNNGELSVDRMNVPAIGVDPVRGGGGGYLTMLSGRPPSGRGEIALGARTLTTLGKSVGQTVRVQVTFRGGTGGPSTTRTLRITGATVLPAFGVPSLASTDLGNGAVVDTSLLSGITADTGCTGKQTCYNFVLLRLRPGANRDGIGTTLLKRAAQGGCTPGQCTFTAAQRPGGIKNYAGIRDTPLVLGAVLTLLAVGTLAHVLLTTVRRRRRDLAVLKTLGLTRRQVQAVVAWNATALAATALLIGVPLGIVAGRWAWAIFAGAAGVAPAPAVNVPLILLIIPATVVLANLIAALPGRQAARLRPGGVLRTEQTPGDADLATAAGGVNADGADLATAAGGHAIKSYAPIRDTPFILRALLAVLTVGTFAHVLLTGVRRAAGVLSPQEQRVWRMRSNKPFWETLKVAPNGVLRRARNLRTRRLVHRRRMTEMSSDRAAYGHSPRTAIRRAYAARGSGAGLQEGDGAADPGALAWGGIPADGAADRAEAVGHVHVAVAGVGASRVEAGAVVAHAEQQAAGLFPQPDLDLRAAGVLGRVLQRLQAAEVHGGLDLKAVPAEARRGHGDRQGRAAAGGAQRLAEPAVGEQRRVDAVGEVAQFLDGGLDLVGELVDHQPGRLRVVGHEVAGKPEVHGEGDQVLLRAVVQVALNATAFGVRTRHDPGPGAAQLVGLLTQLVEGGREGGVQPGVVQREADLAGELGEDTVVLGGERVASGRAAHHDQPEEVPGVAHRRDPERSGSGVGQQGGQPHRRPRRPGHAGPGDHRAFPVADEQRPRAGVRHGGGPLKDVPEAGVDLGGRQRHGLAQRLGELEQQFVHRDGARHPGAEGPQHLVRGLPCPEDLPVSPVGEPFPGGGEGDRGDGRRDHGQAEQPPVGGVGRRPAEPEDDHQVDDRDGGGEPGDGEDLHEQPPAVRAEPGHIAGCDAQREEDHEALSDRRGRGGPADKQVQHRDGERQATPDDRADRRPLHALAVARRRVVVAVPGGGERHQEGQRPDEDGEPGGELLPGGREGTADGERGAVGGQDAHKPAPGPQPAVRQRQQEVDGDSDHEGCRDHARGDGQTVRPVRGFGDEPGAEPVPAERHRPEHRPRGLLPLRRALGCPGGHRAADRPRGDQRGGHPGGRGGPVGHADQQGGRRQPERGDRQQHPREETAERPASRRRAGLPGVPARPTGTPGG
jgi:FtsX-like permease family